MRSTPPNATARVNVGSGQVLSGSSFAPNTDIFVTNGGTIEDDLLANRVDAYLYSGGSAVGVTVASGAFLNDEGGAVLAGDTVTAYGRQYVNNDVVSGRAVGGAVDTSILSGGREDVGSGGLSTSATVGSGGEQEVDQGGLAAGTTVTRDGELYVYFGAATGAVIERGGELDIYPQGSVTGVVMAGATAVVLPNYEDTAALTGLTIASGGQLVLIGDASETGASIAAGGTLEREAIGIFQTVGFDSLLVSAADTFSLTLGYDMSGFVYSGGVLSAATITSGGAAFVFNGGLARDVSVQSGGALNVAYASAIDPQIFAGGTLTIGGDGTIVGAVIHAGGQAEPSYLNPVSSAELLDTTVAGGAVGVAGLERAVSTTVLSGGELFLDGGSASQTIVSAGAVFEVLSGGATDTLVASGGQLTLQPRAGAVFSGGTIAAGGTITFVSSGGSFAFTDFTVESGGAVVEIGGATESGLIIAAGATVTRADVGLFTASGSLVAAADTLYGATVAAYGTLEDTKGGAVSGLTLDAHGSATIYAGATLRNAVVSGQLVVFGGTAASVSVFAGGVVAINSGSVTGTRLGFGASQTIEHGSAMGTVISAGASQVVYAGLALGTMVLAGGVQDVADGGALAEGTIVAAGGEVDLSRGALTYVDLAVGGTIDLQRDAFVSGATASVNRADVLTIVEGGKAPERYTLQLLGNYAGESFHVGEDRQGGSVITLAVASVASAGAAAAGKLLPDAARAESAAGYGVTGGAGGAGGGVGAEASTASEMMDMVLVHGF